MRRRRVGQAVELRKARKDDQLLKRRNIAADEEATSPLHENNGSPVSMSSEEILYGKLLLLLNDIQLQIFQESLQLIGILSVFVCTEFYMHTVFEH